MTNVSGNRIWFFNYKRFHSRIESRDVHWEIVGIAINNTFTLFLSVILRVSSRMDTTLINQWKIINGLNLAPAARVQPDQKVQQYSRPTMDYWAIVNRQLLQLKSLYATSQTPFIGLILDQRQLCITITNLNSNTMNHISPVRSSFGIVPRLFQRRCFFKL